MPAKKTNLSSKFISQILAANCVYRVANQTPLQHAPILSEKTGNTVFLKREDQQPIFSFKVRGAYNKLYHLAKTKTKKNIRVVAASAGNHAQGVAYAARDLNIPVRIVMPHTTPQIKINAVSALGAQVTLHGDSFDNSLVYAQRLVKQYGYTLIHPFDDPLIVAGQGTIGMEIMRQATAPLDALFVPVGGGGLAAGVAAYCKHVQPGLKIYGVESEESASLSLALQHNKVKSLSRVGVFADGVAVKRVGKHTFPLMRECLEPEVIQVSVDEMCAAIRDGFEDTRIMLEPSGALALAGLKKYCNETEAKGQNLGAITSGANVSFDRLQYVTERANLGEGNEIILGVTIPENLGSCRSFCRALGKNYITEFNYRISDPKKATIFVGIKIVGQDREKLLNRLNSHYELKNLTNDRVSGEHVSHMVGGKPSPKLLKGHKEVVLRFLFPQMPGNLYPLLKKLKRDWNITLFHYRNHGAAYAHVLMGLTAPGYTTTQLQKYFSELGYNCSSIHQHDAYKMFLSPHEVET